MSDLSPGTYVLKPDTISRFEHPPLDLLPTAVARLDAEVSTDLADEPGSRSRGAAARRKVRRRVHATWCGSRPRPPSWRRIRLGDVRGLGASTLERQPYRLVVDTGELVVGGQHDLQRVQDVRLGLVACSALAVSARDIWNRRDDEAVFAVLEDDRELKRLGGHKPKLAQPRGTIGGPTNAESTVIAGNRIQAKTEEASGYADRVDDCHAEGRGFESHQPLEKDLQTRVFVLALSSLDLLPLGYREVPATKNRGATNV